MGSSPCGRQIIMNTIKRPNISMRYSLNSRASSGSTVADDGRQHHPDLGAHAAQHHNRKDYGRLDEDEGLRADEALARGEEAAGEAAKQAPMVKAVSLMMVGFSPRICRRSRLPAAPPRRGPAACAAIG